MMGQEEEQARRRFMVLNLIRLSGLATVLVALAIDVGRIDLPQELAYVLAAIGLFDFFVVPMLLARKWKSDRP